MGRLKGSKNKVKKITTEEVNTMIKVLEQDKTIIKRGRGRPKKINNIQEIEITKENPGNKKDIKQEIRKLKKLKLQCKPGSIERIDLHRTIKELKNKLNNIQESITPEKEELIKKIISRKPSYYKDLNIDLTVFTIEELQAHYTLLLAGRGRL